MSMRGKRRSPAEIAKHRRQISSLYLQGCLQAEIAEELNIGQATVSRDLKALRGEWLKDSKADFNAAKAQELAKVDRLEREYWVAWEASKEDKEVTTTEKVKGSATERSKAQVRREGQVGHPSFLAGVQWCIERRCKILGIDAPTRSEIAGPEGGPIQVRGKIIIRKFLDKDEAGG